MNWILYFIIVWLVLCVILACVEVRKAPIIDDSLPFLNGDYDEKADPTEAYMSTFCAHCIKNIDGKFCNNGVHLRMLGDEMIEACKKEGYFEPV